MATNAQIDAAAALVAAPFGPLVRVTDVATLPTPNDDIVLEFDTALAGIKVWMTYTQLTNTDMLARVLGTLGFTAAVESLIAWIGEMNDAAEALTPPHTYADYMTLINLLRDKRNPLLTYGL